MNKEKLTLKDLEDLAKFSMQYAPFREELQENKPSNNTVTN
jgi:hypothetical protein